ncbi:hypothetical protein M422DRAFT_26859 [Sphaerobolus stellatus SS14]|nr:hypothetical protein M422DRAFT_26859 [Sphaerobolus stellatus SS14]
MTLHLTQMFLQTSQLINLIRQEFGFTFAFYAIRLGDRIGYQFTFLIFALLGSGVAFVPMVWLMHRGQQVREQMGSPKSRMLYCLTDSQLERDGSIVLFGTGNREGCIPLAAWRIPK